MVKALARSPRSPELFCAPGNPGIAADATCLPDLDPCDVPEVVEQARKLGANAVIGVDVDYETVGGTMLMVSVSGTAVQAD